MKIKFRPRKIGVKLKRARKIKVRKRREQTGYKRFDDIAPPKEDEFDGMELDEDELVRQLCRESFYDFVKEFWGVAVTAKPVWNWHIRYICGQMQKVAERVMRGEARLYDLLVNVPPGTSKSTIISVMFPAWVWTRMPEARFMCVSYRYPLALQLSRKSRDVVKSEKYQRLFPEIQIRHDQDAKHHFVTTAGGERYAAGSGGNIIGNHGHFILIDDPIDPDNVASDAELENVNLWIEETLSGRKVDKAVSVTILVMQRLAQGDPSSRMLAAGNVKHICLPAVLKYKGKPTNVKPRGLAKFYKDGMLDPIRLSLSVLKNYENKPRGQYLVAGQYLQDPVPPGGGMFKTDLFHVLSVDDSMAFQDPVRAKRNLSRITRFWDKSIGAAGGAYTVGVKLGVTKSDRLVVIDVKRFRLNTFEREREIKKTAREDGKWCVVGLEQEPGSGGLESVQNTIRRLLGHRVKVVKPTTGKGEAGGNRADALSVQVNAGNVMLCKGSWNKEFVDEFRYFPHSTFKDQVDATSGAFTVIWSNRKVVGGLKKGNKTTKEMATKKLKVAKKRVFNDYSSKA